MRASWIVIDAAAARNWRSLRVLAFAPGGVLLMLHCLLGVRGLLGAFPAMHLVDRTLGLRREMKAGGLAGWIVVEGHGGSPA